MFDVIVIWVMIDDSGGCIVAHALIIHTHIKATLELCAGFKRRDDSGFGDGAGFASMAVV